MSSQFMTEEQLAQEQAQYYDETGNYQQQQVGGYDGQYSAGNYMNYDGDIALNQ